MRQRSTPTATRGAARLRHAARTCGPAVVLAALVAIGYFPAVRAGFIWDDDAHVTQSAPLRSVEGLRRIWLEIGATPQYYPLVHTSFWLEYQAWGLEPVGYHLTNLVLHALSVVALWRVLRRLGVPGAWWAAAVFAVHPVHVESVAWISERKNVLSGLFYLSAAWAYLAWALRRGESRRRWLYGLSLGLYVCALLSKTVACTLPVALLVVLWWKRGRVSRGDLLSVVPFLMPGVGAGLVTVWMERHVVAARGAEWDFSLVERVLVAGRAAWFYAWKLVWPEPLVFIYPRWRIDAGQPWQYAYPAGVAAVVAVLWHARGRMGRGPVAAVAVFLVVLSPALGFFDVYPMVFSFVMDHFQYLASIALVTLVVASGSTLAARRHVAGAARAAVGVALVAVLAFLTHERCRAFHDAETLWRDTLAKNPDAWMAHNNLGMALLDRGDVIGARRCFEATIRLEPRCVRAHNNLGGLLVAGGDIAAAVDHFERAIRIEPDFVGARLNLCKVLLASGEAGKAATHYLRALQVDSHVAETQEQLAFLLLHAADRRTADTFYADATRIRGDWPLLVNEMAWILATSPDPERRDPGRAVGLARRAADQTRYTNANVLDTLAAAYAQSGDFAKATATARRGLALVEQTPDRELADAIRGRIQLYERATPYVAPDRAP